MRQLLFALLTACGGSSPAATPSSTVEAGGSVVTADVAPSGAPAASASSVAAKKCADTDLQSVRYEREYVGGAPDKPYNFIDRTMKAAVVACFEQIPPERRATGAAHAVVIEWPNKSFKGGRVGFDVFAGGGARNYPPRASDASFTECVTKAIPEQSPTWMTRDAENIRAIRLTVLAYTRGAASRYLGGSIGHSSGRGSGYGRGSGLPCPQPEIDE
jgi:hypothetical protein